MIYILKSSLFWYYCLYALISSQNDVENNIVYLLLPCWTFLIYYIKDVQIILTPPRWSKVLQSGTLTVCLCLGLYSMTAHTILRDLKVTNKDPKSSNCWAASNQVCGLAFSSQSPQTAPWINTGGSQLIYFKDVVNNLFRYSVMLIVSNPVATVISTQW